MTETVKKTILGLLAAVSVALAAVIVYVNSVPTVPDGGAAGSIAAGGRGGIGGKGGSGGRGAAGTVMVDAGKPVPPTSGFALGEQAWFVDPSWTGEKMFSSQGVLSATYVQQVAKFHVFRMMDANATNCSDQTNWSQRRLPTDSNQTAYGANDASVHGPGVAYEHQISLCNQAGLEYCWFTIPHKATDDYVRQFSSLVAQTLRTGIVPILEYSNETWNGSFCQFAWVNQQGTSGGYPGSNTYYQGQGFAVKRLIDMGAIFKSAVPRAWLVYSWSGNYDIAQQSLNSVYKSSKYNPNGVVIDMVAVAPYVGGYGSSYSNATFKSNVDRLMSSLSQAKAIGASVGIHVLGLYEFGANSYSNNYAYWNAGDSADAYTYMLKQFSSVANGPACLYTHASEVLPNNKNAWGLYDQDGKASPRASVVEQWALAH